MAISRLALLVVLSMLSGCAYGILYTDVTEPLTLDMNKTPYAPASESSSSTQIKEPITGLGLRAEWAGYGIGQAARRGGLERIYFADVRNEMVLGGIWQRTTVIVHGKAKDAEVQLPLEVTDDSTDE